MERSDHGPPAQVRVASQACVCPTGQKWSLPPLLGERLKSQPSTLNLPKQGPQPNLQAACRKGSISRMAVRGRVINLNDLNYCEAVISSHSTWVKTRSSHAMPVINLYYLTVVPSARKHLLWTSARGSRSQASKGCRSAFLHAIVVPIVPLSHKLALRNGHRDGNITTVQIRTDTAHGNKDFSTSSVLHPHLTVS